MVRLWSGNDLDQIIYSPYMSPISSKIYRDLFGSFLKWPRNLLDWSKFGFRVPFIGTAPTSSL